MGKKAIIKLFLEKINWFYSPQALNYNLNTPFSPLPTPHFLLPTSRSPLITDN
ncbi:Helicase PriA essential [Microcystis panniformis FACHB-1757]|uniref:Helicase PriA essential n=1 Tax=Microcystis panniformis FACHB-1757 TaxID=1638788 RepID=A0A0K1RY16_9CHRO|nr:Helicase PriA essential [Microcystis panniformis FACHB-1757]